MAHGLPSELTNADCMIILEAVAVAHNVYSRLQIRTGDPDDAALVARLGALKAILSPNQTMHDYATDLADAVVAPIFGEEEVSCRG